MSKDKAPEVTFGELTHFNKFMESYKGRDKFAKFVQYASRALKYYLLAANPKSAWGKRFAGLFETTATGRKLWRLARSIQEYEAFLKIWTQPSTDELPMYLNILYRCSFMWYWFFDNINYLCRAGFLKYDKKRVGTLAAYGWTIGIASNFTVTVLELYKINGKIAKQLKSIEEATAANKDSAELKAELNKLLAKRVKLTQDLIRFSCDLVVSSSSAGIPVRLFGKAAAFSDGVLGILGCISAAIAGYQVWNEDSGAKPADKKDEKPKNPPPTPEQIAKFLRPRKIINQLRDDQLKGKRVFVRVDFNVPQDATGKITDDTRIREALPTLKYLKSKGAKTILATHLGRPQGVDPKLTLKPIAERLQELLECTVVLTDSPVGAQVKAAVSAMKEGDIVLLENIRWLPGEEKNDEKLCVQLQAETGAEVYVNDAFGTAHRAHASTAGIKRFINGPAVAGFLMEKEIKFLFPLITNPVKPFVAIIGGSKVDTKIKVIKTLLAKCDKLLFGGAMIYPFLKAQGISVGGQVVDPVQMKIAEEVVAEAKKRNVQLVFPIDLICADQFPKDGKEVKTLEKSVTEMPAGWLGLDIGPKSVELFGKHMQNARTILWNGPMGVFEVEAFARGTIGVAKVMASKSDATTVIGGGDSVAAAQQAGVADQISHVSTGGGASLELLEGAILPGIDCLDVA